MPSGNVTRVSVAARPVTSEPTRRRLTAHDVAAWRQVGPPYKEHVVSIKDLERELAKAERKASAPFLADVERARRQAYVVELERELEDQLAGHGRRRR
jgi:hypothetical protein